MNQLNIIFSFFYVKLAFFMSVIFFRPELHLKIAIEIIFFVFLEKSISTQKGKNNVSEHHYEFEGKIISQR